MSIPENGFYYHYKHDAGKGEHDHAYEVTGLAFHTETEEYLVLYRPLYESSFLGEAGVLARPLSMFMENIEKEGKTIPRFSHITNPELVAKLSKIRGTLYS